ncbi:branched-chain amino acid ABC transporter permease [Pseudogemmobacter humi]|uniref:Leucine/isoleucine/valine transporter permease subunit n=1 Tax=Pseudogemmobacter humi TaxID=2483812 RepID=A0A3P5WHW3_9RHOB|nr:branched-chain amino acid ABC transporter permease [Pseudogemmobacter humi]VDC19077.1 leucine/isoleucine/valine transporter permease subunit [Pseudogemmobacter humi]
MPNTIPARARPAMLTSRAVQARAADRDLVAAFVLLALLAATPLVLSAFGQEFWTDVVLRAMILAIAAASLNFLIGLGGLVSLGHAAFLGIGGYATGILADFDIDNGFIQLAAVLGASALFALVTGMVALRTKGVHFIMITLAFAQMVYFTMIGLRQFGGDDGLTINYTSMFGGFDLGRKDTLYYVVLAVLAVVMLGYARLRKSDFGLLLKAAKGNERRVSAVGFDPYRYRLAAYVVAGMTCALAGFLDANFTSFVTPGSMSWITSAELIFIVIVGGVATICGPIVGALVFLLIEEIMGGVTVYWHFWFGLFLIAIVLFARNGLVGLLTGGRR